MSTASKAARLSGSLLLARKGEATPAISRTIQNNPGLAWGGPKHPDDFQAEIHDLHPSLSQENKPRLEPQESVSDTVDLTVRIDDEFYLRLKYLAQMTERNVQHVLHDALERHFRRQGVLKTLKLAVKPE